jgi:hypothetical protein
VARELKYHSPNTDLAALQRELGTSRSDEEFDNPDELDDDTDDESEDEDEDELAARWGVPPR